MMRAFKLILLIFLGFRLMASIRHPYAAGAFYPSNPAELKLMIGNLLQQASPPKLDGRILGIQVPHAGYIFSGRTAAYAFKLLKGRKVDTVIMIGPSHFYPFSGAAVYWEGYWETPLGRVKIDEELAREFLKLKSGFFKGERFHKKEHSLEVELPFLQTVLQPGFKILPIVIGPYEPQKLLPASKKIAKILSKKNVLILISSDLSHYHTLEECKKRDERTIREMLSLRPGQFLWMASKGMVEACGASAIALGESILIEMGANKAVLLRWGNSSEGGAGTKRVVGYSAVAFLKTEKPDGGNKIRNNQSPPENEKLTAEEKKYLLVLARKSIETELNGENFTPPTPPTERLKQPRGAFVTLKKKGKLRGCIGYIIPVKPLYITVYEVARAAAFRDPRFPPLRKEELKDIEIEISVLTKPRRTFPARIKVGRDGIIVSYMGRQGVLLPQVPVELGWDRIEFLNAVCLKAGVEPDCWRKGAKLYSFQAEVFKEVK